MHIHVLAMPSTGTTGATATVCDNLVDKWIQFEGLTAGTVIIQVEGRIGSSAWLNIGDPLAADDIMEIPEGLHEIRLNRTTVGTGTPIATMYARG